MIKKLKQTLAKYILSVNLVLNVLLVVAIVIIILHDFLFAEGTELFAGGAELWALVYRVSLALVGSYIFYYVVVHLKTLRDKSNLLPFLTSKTTKVIGNAETIAGHLRYESGHDFAGNYPSLADTEAMLKAVKPFSTIAWFQTPEGTPGTQLQYLKLLMNETRESISHIYPLMPFLPSEYVRLLNEIDDSGYFHLLDEVTGAVATDIDLSKDLSFLAPSLQRYFESAKKMGEYKNAGLAW